MKRFLTTALLVAAGPALAHTGQGGTSGLAAGIAHPILGADHLLAMLAVGLWSGFALPERFWLAPAVFMAAMAAGAGLSWAGVPIPAVETWIVLSVVVFGLLTLAARPRQGAAVTRAALAAIAVFAACHGHAHATEASGHAAAYLVGFLTATGALHLAGVGIARGVARTARARMVQGALGAGIAAAGVLMMAG